MKRITMTVSDDKVSAIVHLISDQCVSFHVDPVEQDQKDRNRPKGSGMRGVVSPNHYHLRKTNRTLMCVLKIGGTKETFKQTEIEDELETLQLSRSSASPTITKCRQLGFVEKTNTVGKGFVTGRLTPKGRDLYHKLVVMGEDE